MALVIKNPSAKCRQCKRCRFDPWARKIPWRRAWQPKYSCLENSMDRGVWRTIAYRVAKSQT